MKPIPVKYRHVNLDNCLKFHTDVENSLSGKPFDVIGVISNVKKPSKYGVVTFCYKMTRVNQIPGLFYLDMNFALCNPKDEFHKKFGCELSLASFREFQFRDQVYFMDDDYINCQCTIDAMLLNMFINVINNDLDNKANVSWNIPHRRLSKWVTMLQKGI